MLFLSFLTNLVISLLFFGIPAILTLPNEKSIIDDIIGWLTPSIQINSQCKNDIIAYGWEAVLHEPWALKVIDSWGKMPSGVFEGNMFTLGSFDECLDVSKHWAQWRNGTSQSSSPKYIHTFPDNEPHYCIVDFDIGNNIRKHFIHANSTVNFVKAIHGDIMPLILDPPGLFYKQGWCLPSSCNIFDVYYINQYLLKIMHVKIPTLDTLKDALPMTRPYVSYISCIDINHTITYNHWASPQSFMSSGNESVVITSNPPPVINPTIYDDTTAKTDYSIARTKYLTWAALFFGTVTFFILLAALFDVLYALEPKTQFLIEQRGREGTDHRWKYNLFMHTRKIAQSLSPFKNIYILLTANLAVFDNFGCGKHLSYFSGLSPVPSTEGDDGFSEEEAIGTLSTATTSMNTTIKFQAIIQRYIDVIAGIRALSLAWVILADVCILAVPYISNPLELQDRLDTFLMLTVNGAHFALDTFWVVSGILLAFALIPNDNNNNLSGTITFSPICTWLLIYLYKYVRFTWPYLAVMLWYIWVLPYIPANAHGPLFLGCGIRDVELCRKSWWTNLLYLNNFVRSEQSCMQWTWYLATEAQFFLVVGPIFVFIYRKSRILAHVLMVHLMLAGLITSFVLSYVNGYKSVLSLNDPGYLPFYYDYWIRPYIRILPYLVGLWFGCFITFSHSSHTENRNNSDSLNANLGPSSTTQEIDAVIYGESNTNFATRPTFSSPMFIRRASKAVHRHVHTHGRDPTKRAVVWAVLIALALALIYGIRPEVRSLMSHHHYGHDNGSSSSNHTLMIDSLNVRNFTNTTSLLFSSKMISNVTFKSTRNERENGTDTLSLNNVERFRFWKFGGFNRLTAAFYNSTCHLVWALFIVWMLWAVCTVANNTSLTHPKTSDSETGYTRFENPAGVTDYHQGSNILVNEINGENENHDIAFLNNSNNQHHHGVIYALLSCRVWRPLSNLAFIVYLTHPIIILSFYRSLRTPLEYSTPYFFLLFVGLYVMAYVLAVPFSLAFEIPIISFTQRYFT